MRSWRSDSIIFIFTISLLGFLPFYVEAQGIPSVNLGKAKLAWDWTQGTGGAATEFHAKCGTATGIYSLVKILPDPAARSVMIKDVIASPGKYFCIVTAANPYGESPPSNEVSFDAGAVPANPANLQVQAQ